MGTARRKIECEGENCGALLGFADGELFEVRRGGLQVTYGGPGVIHVVCYNPRCRHLTVLRLPIESERDDE